jgi:DNA-binding MarR family transcriptional regulator
MITSRPATVPDVVRELGYLTLGTRFKRIGERLQAHTQRILDAHGLEVPAGQFPFLAALDQAGPLTIGELADAVGVTQPGATRAAAQLADAGYVTITQASEDQRRKVVALTTEGKRLVAAGKRTAWPLIECAVGELCRRLEGPLLAQLVALEDGLVAQPLDRRPAASPRGGAEPLEQRAATVQRGGAEPLDRRATRIRRGGPTLLERHTAATTRRRR